MATLVLTAVGTAIGGPIGGAIGAMLGQQVDRAVFLSPKGRQGPRLSDLRVQTSSYGAAIPRLFGTVRVAGCVIWSTDLIETSHEEGGGKGQPSTTLYDYAASFAVALSTRPIREIRRIWADGNLIRGAAGDWKVSTGFRVHRGDEDQPPDPLIDSLEANPPAHRGLAYVVFEHLPLADFGNRLPSLTFEVVADDEPPSIGAVARDIGGGVMTGDGPVASVPGFAASGDNAGAVIEMLARMCGGWVTPRGGGMALNDRMPATPLPLDADAATRERRSPVEGVARTLAISYYDMARDYQIGVQQVRRAGAGWRDDSIDLPVVLEAATARRLATVTMARAERERVTRTVTLDVTALGIAPGDSVAFPRERGAWRVTRASVDGMAVTVELVPAKPAIEVTLAADAGRAVVAPDLPAGQTLIEVAELPPLDDRLATLPEVTVFVAGTTPGWRRAAVLFSRDDGHHWERAGAMAAPAVIGRLATGCGAGGAAVEDRISRIEVTLAHDGMGLSSVTPEALDRGANMALIGDELVQFRDAERIASARWRVSLLWRARRGTAPAAHVAGERFVLIERHAMRVLPMAFTRPGERLRWLASGVGDVAGPVEARLTLDGRSILPLAPIRLRHVDTAQGAQLQWVRRSRLGWRWQDGADVPLGEEREAYRIVTTTPQGGERTEASDRAALSVAALPTGAIVSVRQQGTNGVSPATILEI